MAKVLRPRLAGAIVCAFMLAAVAAVSAALCEGEADLRDTLSVSASVSPPGMAARQEASVYLTLVNSATEAIDDIRVTRPDGTVLCEVGTLSGSGQSSYVFSETVTPTKRQLEDGGVEYVIKYTLGKGTASETPRELSVLAPIEKLEAQPELEFTRSVSSTYVQKGEEVSITYRLRNTGNVALTGIRVKDALYGEIGEVERLEPGKKHAFTLNLTVEDNCQSAPEASYSYPDAPRRVSQKLDSLDIFLADEYLELMLEADKSAVSPGEVVTLRLKLVNRGDVTYDRLEISDQALGNMGSVPGELLPGQEYVFVKTVNMKTTTTFMFSVSGESTGGKQINSGSNMLTVAVTPVVDSIQLLLEATPDETALAAPGQVNFTIRVSNLGELDIRGVQLSEQTHGEIKTLAVAAPGDTLVNQSYYISGDTTFIFTAELTDTQGGELTVLSNPVPVSVGAVPGAADVEQLPTPTALLGIEDTPYRIEDGNAMFARMMLGIIFVLAALIAVGVIGALSRHKKKQRQKKRQMARLRRVRAPRQAPPPPPQPTRVDQDTGVYRKVTPSAAAGPQKGEKDV